MSQLKTQVNDASVTDFLNTVEDKQKQQDCRTILALMEKVTGKPAKMWGTSIVGFDQYHYQYASGREGDWMITGFSPRKQALTLYIMSGFSEYNVLMQQLGKCKTGKSCLYVKKLSDIDLSVLEQLITKSVAYMKRTYG